jgi:hypothetical protein
MTVEVDTSESNAQQLASPHPCFEGTNDESPNGVVA